MMTKRWLRLWVLVLLAYLGPDVLTPEIPGAFNFDLDASIDVLSGSRTSVVSLLSGEAFLPPKSDDLARPERVRSVHRPHQHTERRFRVTCARLVVARDPAAAVEPA